MPLFLHIFIFTLLILHAPPATTAITTTITGVYSDGDRQVLTLKKLKWTQQQTTTTNCFPQRTRTEKNAIILELHNRDYCSRPRSDGNQRLLKNLLSDQIWVHSLQSRIKILLSKGINQELSQSQIPLVSGAKLQTLNYIVTVTLGGRNVTLIVDTGSDLTWVQCEPCSSCYNQQEPLFNPSQSPAYKPVLCKSTTCQDLASATGSSGVCGFNSTTCNYYVTYGDGSYTRGDLANDNLVLGTTLVKDFVFGCGRDNDGLFGGVSGLMGLGRSGFSVVSQTYDVFEGVFSYCLPSVTDEGSGSLILGDNTSLYKNFTPFTFTNLISNTMMPTFYFLNLTGISIGGVPLQDSSFGKNEMLIDSGTVITRLKPSVYNALKTEFLKQFTGYPKAPAFSILDTCFNLSAYEEVDIPTMKMHFGTDAMLTVDVTGIFYFAKADASQVCLAIARLSDEEEVGIIGNYQQKNTRVVYNTKASTLGFAKETCTLD
ncbi:aspartyl protease family protein At5g10770-like [Bidens hawaiensis]|uniref:aspartyl protease family protein At5g10770-like n=1 Tax=Bidens hawaiensis TaxID=980011 RepID=UPI00404B1DEA